MLVGHIERSNIHPKKKKKPNKQTKNIKKKIDLFSPKRKKKKIFLIPLAKEANTSSIFILW